MDELDTKIIALLQEDGRASNAGIARKVGVSEGTVRRRLKRLVDDEFVRVVALLDPVKMGYASEALVGVQVDLDKVDQVADDLSELEEVTWTAGHHRFLRYIRLGDPRVRRGVGHLPPDEGGNDPRRASHRDLRQPHRKETELRRGDLAHSQPLLL